MTDEERMALRPGDRVMVRMDDDTEREYVVRRRPWLAFSGVRLILLEGRRGGYSLLRVVRKCE